MKRLTLNDVARAAEVSRATVSYVVSGTPSGRVQISDKTRQRVLAAAAELGYEPDARAQALRSGRTQMIGAVFPDLLNPHFAEYATGIEQEARSAGYHILFSSTALDDEYGMDVYRALARGRVDGLILGSPFAGESEESRAILLQLQKQQLPMVAFNDLSDVDSCASDYGAATREVMAHLVALGHRRIALIYGIAGNELAEDRRQGYLESLDAAGLAHTPDLIAKCGATIQDGYAAAASLLRLPARPTAIIAINDLLAIGALRSAADLGLHVPTDLSLVGYDDIQLASYLVPRLTTVTRDTFHLGRQAFRMLLARINNPDLPRQRYYKPAKLIIRDSIGAAPPE